MMKTILVIGPVKPDLCSASELRLRRLGHTPVVEHHELRELLVDADLSSSEEIRCQFDTLILHAAGWEEWKQHKNFYVHFRQLVEKNPDGNFLIAGHEDSRQLPGFLRRHYLSMTD